MTERVMTDANGRKYITTEPRLDQGPDYERGFVDGMQKQMQSSVDKADNRVAQPAQKRPQNCGTGFCSCIECVMGAAQEPVAWGFRHDDGAIYDCITPEAHADCEGEYTVPLYTTLPAAQPAQGATDIAAIVEGMKVSVDVSTGEHDSGNRLFGKVTLAQENQGSKHGLILLVQDPEPNFKPPLPAQPVQEPVAWMIYTKDGQSAFIRADEREACAKVLESISNAPDMQSYAAAIRARGQA